VSRDVWVIALPCAPPAALPALQPKQGVKPALFLLSRTPSPPPGWPRFFFWGGAEKKFFFFGFFFFFVPPANSAWPAFADPPSASRPINAIAAAPPGPGALPGKGAQDQAQSG